jgi:hypothetical protein
MSDQWSFCVVMYELLSGVVPFEGANYNALLRAIIEDEPAPLTAHGITDDDLSFIIARGMIKAQGARWSSMRDLGEQLAGWLSDRGIAEDITGTSLHRTWFRDPQSYSWSEISQPGPSSNRLYSRPSTAERTALTSGVESAGIRTNPTPPSQPELLALAELNSGIDSAAMWLRIERRRRTVYALVFLLTIIGAALALLASAGLLVP